MSAQALAAPHPGTGERRITRWVLLRILWRSFFFQSACNYERMQNVGFCFCILPALQVLYRDDDLKRAMQRHLAFFNSHPYMADALLEIGRAHV